MIKEMNPESKLFGFLMGPYGLYNNKNIELERDYIELYRNMGGFDMICKFTFNILHCHMISIQGVPLYVKSKILTKLL